MTHSSIGSGANIDGNENHPADGVPPKTMGEETQASLPASSQAASVQQDPQAPADASAESELVAQEMLGSLPAGPDGDNPGNFPDGPNVAPSPWEKDAAQGKG